MQIVTDSISFNSFEGSGPRSDRRNVTLPANAT